MSLLVSDGRASQGVNILIVSRHSFGRLEARGKRVEEKSVLRVGSA